MFNDGLRFPFSTSKLCSLIHIREIQPVLQRQKNIKKLITPQKLQNSMYFLGFAGSTP
ncbi:MAG: hypothetical protein ACI9RO_001327 [Alteromonas macleodii]|jgi:hypothetical protein